MFMLSILTRILNFLCGSINNTNNASKLQLKDRLYFFTELQYFGHKLIMSKK